MQPFRNKMYLYWIITQLNSFVKAHKRLVFLITALIFISNNLISQPNFVACTSSGTQGFIKNCGQIHDQNGQLNPAVLFLYPASGFNLQLRKDGFSYDLYTIADSANYSKPSRFDLPSEKAIISFNRIDVSFVNSNPNVKVSGLDESGNRFNYYNLNRNSLGITGAKVYHQVRYQNLYPGIDLVFFTEGNQLKYNFIIKAGANLELIRLKYNGLPLTGFQKSVSPINTLKIKLQKNIFSETIPASWLSREDNQREPIDVFYQICENGEVKFSAEKNIPNNSILTIDPVPIFSGGTYYGGNDDDFVRHVTTDSVGNVYMSGYTYSLNNIATVGTYMGSFGGGSFDAFLSKFSRTGTRIWSTYFGGSSNDDALSAAIDDSNNVYLTGYTRSTASITTPGAHQAAFGGGYIDGFLVKFDSNGLRKWATYYGGDGYDRCYSVITVQDKLIVTGRTQSSNNISTVGSHQPVSGGDDDAFIVAFNGSGVRLWGSYYGASGMDYGMSLAKDSHNDIYLTGHTNSVTDIASAKAFQPTYGGGNIDAFLAKFSISGKFIWGTYFGGDQDDEGWAVSTSTDNSIYISGITNSINGIASATAFKDSLFGVNTDAFLAKFSPTGNRLWATYYGGDSSDAASSLTFSNNKVYITGYSYSNSNIATPRSFSDTFNGVCDAYIAGFDTSGYRFWSTYYGGVGYDEAFSIGSDLSNNIYIAGFTESLTKIADSNGYQSGFGGGSFDAFLAKFREPCFGYSAKLFSFTNADCSGNADGSAIVTVSKGTAPYSFSWNSGDTGSVNLKLKAGTWSCIVSDVYGCTDSVQVSISEPTGLNITSLINDVSCAGDSNGLIDLTVSGGTRPYSFLWNTGDSLNKLTNCKAAKYSCIISDSNNCKDSMVVEIREPDKIVFSPTLQNPTCFNLHDGKIQLYITGGILPYKFLWDVGDSTAYIIDLAAGKYKCWVTDSNGCTDCTEVLLEQPDSIQIHFLKTDDNGTCNGNATAIVIGGIRPYEYKWNPGLAADSIILNLCNGIYRLEITDSNFCKAYDSVFIDKINGVIDENQNVAIILYPNPTENYFKLYHSSPSQKNYDLIIYSTSGKKVLKKKAVEWNTKVDISTLSKGVYLLKIVIGDRTFDYKFVK